MVKYIIGRGSSEKIFTMSLKMLKKIALKLLKYLMRGEV
jgi:hypothetical protein